MLRFRLNLPQMKGFIWFGNYVNFFYDPKFWNTVYISLLYAFLTVGLELMLGLAIALLLQKQTRFNNIVSILLLLPLMTAPALGVSHVETDDQSKLRHPQLFRGPHGFP